MKALSVRLLLAAAALLLIAGILFGFIQSWVYAGMLWAGALGCLTAALNFGSAEHADAAADSLMDEPETGSADDTTA